MKHLFFFGAVLLVCAACGAKPPMEDLNVAKAALARAEEARAQEFAPDEYGTASAKLEEGEGMIVPKKNKKNAEAKKSLLLSQASAEEAYQKSAPAYADYNIAEAKKAKVEADNLKAGVAVRDRFAEAEALLAEAGAEKEAGRFEASWDKSIKARSIFREAAAEALKKRTRADEAIRNAESAIRNAEERAGEE